MSELDTVKDVIAQNRDDLSRFNVEEIYLFGSIVRGERSEHSDIDVLATFNDEADLYNMSELQAFLEDLLGSDVDIVSKRAVRAEFKQRINDEAVNV